MTLTLIKQRGLTDCGIAALATVLEVTYEQVWDAQPAETQAKITAKGMNDEIFDRCLVNLGFIKDKHWVRRVYAPYWGSIRGIQNLMWGRRAMVTAWSKNEQESAHFIVFDGTDGDEVVLDPSTRLTYDTWQEVEPKQMILFAEEAVRKWLKYGDPSAVVVNERHT
jgi:ABC-type bacteriocin/lantibiotic exporter with double-glycine peptidase domain